MNAPPRQIACATGTLNSFARKSQTRCGYSTQRPSDHDEAASTAMGVRKLRGPQQVRAPTIGGV